MLDANLIGVLGRVFGQSKSALNLSILSACLCVNWTIGYVAAFRTKKELSNIHFRNLNGSLNFETLMAFC